MPLFRKKPVVLEAWQWIFAAGYETTPAWLNDAFDLEYGVPGSAAFWLDGNQRDDADPAWRERPHIAIVTLEGVHYATPGDWIIKGVNGELYPCKPDIFEATYEPVEER